MGSLTTNLGLTVPTVNGDVGPLWANEINGDLAILDAVLGNVLNLSVAGSANVTLSPGQAQNLILNFSGGLTGNITVFLPGVGRFYCVQNNTTGAFSLQVGAVSGVNFLNIPQGLAVFVWTDGITTRISSPPGWTELSNTAVSGAAAVALSLPLSSRRFRLTLHGVTVSGSAASLALTSSSNGGSSYATSGYSGLTTRSLADSTITVIPAANLASATITPSLQASGPWDGVYEIYPGGGSLAGVLRGDGFGTNLTPNFIHDRFGFSLPAPGGLPINAIQIAASAGTFSGVLIVEGLP